MTTLNRFAAVAALVSAAAYAMPTQASDSKSMQLSKPLAGSTMFFSDRYATAYYTIDKASFKTVVTVAPGPDGKGNPQQFVNSLRDGESAEYSVGGYGDNAIKVKLKLTRTGDTVKADVSTEVPQSAS